MAVALTPGREQTRARYPDEEGVVERDGVRLHWERYGTGEPATFFLPTWSIVHSRVWKQQLPFFARHGTALTFDGRGNGRSGRPSEPDAYREREFADDALAVLDAAGLEQVVLVGFSAGAGWAVLLAAEHPERVAGVAFIGPAVPLGDHAARLRHAFDEPLETYEGWAKYNRHYWLERYPDFLSFFFERVFNEPHSTKPIEDCVGWGLEIDPETLVATHVGRSTFADRDAFLEACSRIRCPTLVLHGTEDEVRPFASGAALAEATGGQLVALEGAGHGPHVRDPVQVNLLLREFVCSVTGPRRQERRWRRGRARPLRALYVSSPIGLGHARRDVAVAQELRQLVPGLEVDWLAQHPVTAVLEAEGERIHPASGELASESGHIESESGEHDLHCFQAIRRMDEILLANFMVFHDLVREEHYDLWIGDEAWEVDYYLHENPELKTARYVWLADFVGWLPTPEGGEHEAFLTADYNAEMIRHIARYPGVRDRAIFVGSPEDIVPDTFGPGLPGIRDWTEQNFEFAGYVTGFRPAGDRFALRRDLGWEPDEPVCVVTVGGSGVGGDLLRRAIDAFPLARDLVPGLRMVVVAGPRIDPSTFPAADGLEVRPYVHELHRLLAACDLAVVQGGLTTAMELTACGTPFVYVPLRRHFEQQLHVHHRLRRYGAGRRLDFDEAAPSRLAAVVAEEIGRACRYRPVERDGAARAAALVAELLH